MKLQARVKKALKERGIIQKWLAAHIGIKHPQRFSEWMYGNRKLKEHQKQALEKWLNEKE